MVVSGRGIFLRGLDRVIAPPASQEPNAGSEGIKTSWHGSSCSFGDNVAQYTEGLAVGVAFGASRRGYRGCRGLLARAAVALAIGIGIQNFPEEPPSLCLEARGRSPRQEFFYGQLSAVVEPIAGGGRGPCCKACPAPVPYALAFAAGAMIFVALRS